MKLQTSDYAFQITSSVSFTIYVYLSL